MCIIVLNFYVCQARQRPVTRAASVRHARETPVVEKIRSRPVVETAVAAALGWNDPSPLPACSHCDKKKLKTFGLMIAIENVLAAVDAAGVRSPVQTADTTARGELSPAFDLSTNSRLNNSSMDTPARAQTSN